MLCLPCHLQVFSQPLSKQLSWDSSLVPYPLLSAVEGLPWLPGPRSLATICDDVALGQWLLSATLFTSDGQLSSPYRCWDTQGGSAAWVHPTPHCHPLIQGSSACTHCSRAGSFQDWASHLRAQCLLPLRSSSGYIGAMSESRPAWHQEGSRMEINWSQA